MQRLTVQDRLSAGAIGAVIGAFIGLAIAWLIGIYSNTLGPAAGPLSFKAWSAGVAALFGVGGLIFGPAVGTALGHAISGLFAFERFEPPVWLVVLALLAGAFFWWWI